MKSIELKDTAVNKIKKGEFELREEDFNNLPKGFIPGEWVLIENKKNNLCYIGYINLFSTSSYKIKILKSVDNTQGTFHQAGIEEIVLKSLLDTALMKRKDLKILEHGFRLVHGGQDNLPGLIADVFMNAIIVQINSAGIDRFRDSIKKYLNNVFPEKEVYFLDNEAYRKHEQLPSFESSKLPPVVKVQENGFDYEITSESFQKIGFYYDHRMNRRKLENTIKDYHTTFATGVDLFSYVGSWGLHMLRAGVKHVTFVDQGDMGAAISRNVETNGFKDRGYFVRSDVFKYLDQALESKTFFDVVVSDPPAFTKSEKNKSNAIVGYEKLHLKCLKVLNPNGLFVAASCTHYVSHEELDKTVQVAAARSGTKLQLLDLGVQSPDHPFQSLSDKGNYIKYILYKRV